MARDIQEILNEHWSRHLDAPATDARLRTSELPVPTPAGPVIAATDGEGNRHILVPIPANQRSRRTLDGANLRVRESAIESESDYQRYLDVCAVNRRLDGLFNDLGADLLVAIESAPDRAVAATNDVLWRWKALFAPAPRALSDDQVVGLFGELFTLQTLLQSSPSATDTWRGPLGEPHDFVSAAGDIEVKATSDPDSNRTRIHGIDQLETIEGRPLFVHWVRVRPESDGESLVELALRISEAVDDRELFFERLAAAGLTLADQDRYSERFAVVDSVTMAVAESFPRITPGALGRVDVALPIYAVEYSIDLPVADALTTPQRDELMEKVAQGAAQ
ncbi:PD-(D/E)XK motif protein [Tsukamurella paurometabola]|uniref:PD-(D/E)XK motif protein n=1 Tax=Tsukamurella paurometabola TaxID=2061 RepID=A0ABS5NI34_TSUPA|nr:PD-(D/E)XK motif protein [Tsukamurella paurometabola]MBS4103918.1 PD-(D/E)XK motif protein [Tsukamurella paurometabola]